ncbi:MAG: hypothetical protein PWQ43_1127 [Rikenellaceae bacterium]|nr:hypothetical protein [Rikenellaceae bacterium]
MAYVTKEKLFSKEWFKAYSYILLGTFIMAVGFVMFISPYKFAPGGVYGISIILHHLFNFPIGITGLSIDIPLILIGMKILGAKFGIKTIVGSLSLSGWISLLEFTWGYEPLLKDDPLVSAIFGGIILGIGLGLIFKSKATSGGTDIIAMILNKYTRIAVGQLLIIVDSIIVLAGFIAFEDWRIPFYSWIIIYLTGRVVDMIIEGVSYEKACLIISDKTDEIKNKILLDLDRSGNLIPIKGLYSDSDKQMIMTVVNRREVEMLKSYIRQIDPQAFMTVVNASEVIGQGFKNIDDAVITN